MVRLRLRLPVVEADLALRLMVGAAVDVHLAPHHRDFRALVLRAVLRQEVDLLHQEAVVVRLRDRHHRRIETAGELEVDHDLHPLLHVVDRYQTVQSAVVLMTLVRYVRRRQGEELGLGKPKVISNCV